MLLLLFLTPDRNMFHFWLFWREHVIFNVKWVEVRRMNEIFSVKLYYKMSDLFYLWDFLLEDLKIRNSDDVQWQVWMNINKLYAPNNIFKKRILKTRIRIIHIWSKFCFVFFGCGTNLGSFSQYFFFFISFFVVGQQWWPPFLLSSTTMKKLTTALDLLIVHGVHANIFKIPAHFCLKRGSFPAFFHTLSA